MKYYRKQIQSIIVVVTFLIMTLIIWGVWTGSLLDHEETQEQMIDGILDKMK